MGKRFGKLKHSKASPSPLGKQVVPSISVSAVDSGSAPVVSADVSAHAPSGLEILLIGSVGAVRDSQAPTAGCSSSPNPLASIVVPVAHHKQ